MLLFPRCQVKSVKSSINLLTFRQVLARPLTPCNCYKIAIFNVRGLDFGASPDVIASVDFITHTIQGRTVMPMTQRELDIVMNSVAEYDELKRERDELLKSLIFLTDAAETEPGMAIYTAHIEQARALIDRQNFAEEYPNLYEANK